MTSSNLTNFLHLRGLAIHTFFKKVNNKLAIFIFIQTIIVYIFLSSINYSVFRETQYQNYTLTIANHIYKGTVGRYFTPYLTALETIVLDVSGINNLLINPTLGYSYVVKHFKDVGYADSIITIYNEFGDPIVDSNVEAHKNHELLTSKSYYSKLFLDKTLLIGFKTYINTTNNSSPTFEWVSKITYKNGTFAGLVVISVPLKSLPNLCSYATPSNGYDSLISFEGVIIQHCKFPSKLITTSIGKSVYEVLPSLEGVLDNAAKTTYSDDDVLVAHSSIDGLPLYVTSVSNKKESTSVLQALSTQSHLYLIVLLSALIGLYMLYHSALVKSKITVDYTEDDLSLDNVLYAHLEWRYKFIYAIHHKTPLEAANIADHTACVFGRWLIRHTHFYAQLKSFTNCVEAHKDFHFQATLVLAKVNAKEFDEAFKDLANDSEFFKASEAVAIHILALKNDIAKSPMYIAD